MAELYEGISHVVAVASGADSSCDLCNEWGDGEKFVDSINHYISAHGYRLLHVGSESGGEMNDGNPRYFTVAVLGK